mgnify:CR=1 FL=1
MSTIFRPEKKGGDILYAEDYNTDTFLPSYRLRKCVDNVKLDTSTTTSAEVLRATLGKLVHVPSVSFFKVYLQDAVFKNLSTTSVTIVEIIARLWYYRQGDRLDYAEVYTTAVRLDPGASTTRDLVLYDPYVSIDSVIDEVSVELYIKASTTDGTTPNAEVTITKACVMLDL